MERSEVSTRKTDMLRDYLRVDAFITDMVAARALSSAFELRIIELLGSGKSASFEEIRQVSTATDYASKLLLRLLEQGGVLEKSDDLYCLTPEFMASLQYQDLLLAKLDFAHIAAHDFIDSLSVLAVDPLAFMNRAGMFRLFDYGTALEISPENLKRTARWMRITTMLTRYEAPVCFSFHDVGKYRHMLDVGGNSGEFALQACKLNSQLQATVFDLPVVCEIGRQHLGSKPESGRIRFVKGNARADELPAGSDLITFKSMLHDWPEQEVRMFLRKACAALQPGGTLLIFERGPFSVDDGGLAYCNIPILLFAHTLRSPDLYLECLAENGLKQITLQWIDLDMPFFLITALKCAFE